MKAPKKISFVLVPHKKGCTCRWSGITDGFYHGNFAGNENAKRGSHHIWHKVLCNNIDCPGIKAVHSSVLINA